MENHEYENMAEVEKNYWWHNGKKKVISTILHKFFPNKTNLEILNIGCGMGGSVKLIAPYGAVQNVDTEEACIESCRKMGIENLHLFDGKKLPFPDNHFDLAVAFDVLEHIKDDAYALEDWFRVLKPGGHLFITVPAYQWLFSQHDVALHHFRRYSRKQISTLFNAAHFKILKCCYAFAATLPLVVVYRLIDKAVSKKNLTPEKAKSSYVRPPRLINYLLSKLSVTEALLLHSINLPFGSSVICIAQKKEKFSHTE